MFFLRILVLLLAVGQILVSFFGGFNGQGAYSAPLITPATYAFSIWGVIMLGSLAYGIYQLVPSQRKNGTYDQVSVPLSVTFTGFILWVLLAARGYLWWTVIVFLFMLVSLWVAYPKLAKAHKNWKPLERVLVLGTFGLYLGWLTVAFPLNIVAALVNYNIISPDERSLGVYLFILIVAVIFSLWSQQKVGKNPYFTGAIVWGFVAVAVRTGLVGSYFPMFFSIVAVVALIFSYLRLSVK